MTTKGLKITQFHIYTTPGFNNHGIFPIQSLNSFFFFSFLGRSVHSGIGFYHEGDRGKHKNDGKNRPFNCKCSCYPVILMIKITMESKKGQG